MFTRAIGARNPWAAETARRELGIVSLLDALDYVELLAITLAESQFALAALGSIRAGDAVAVDVLRRLLRRVQPTLTRRLAP